MPLTRPLDPDSGSQHTYLFALQKAVEEKVSVCKRKRFLGFFCQRLLATGVVTSPNYPGNYPANLNKTETIEVEEGMVLSLEFTAFNIEHEQPSTCQYDHLTITDGDGTTLMEKSCGSDGYLVIGESERAGYLPPKVWSRSNKVNLVFITDHNEAKTGWSVSWSAVTPGECQQHL